VPGLSVTMTVKRQLRISHIIVTVQYLLSATVVVAWILSYTGLHWPIVFSLLVQGLALMGLGALVYGFLAFRGSVGERRPAEHPFSSSIYYRFLYLLLPVLGGLVGSIDYSLAVGPLYGLLGLAFGTVFVASVMWLVIDPVVGLVESSFGESRQLRRERLAVEREQREQRRREKQRFIDRLIAEQEARLAKLRPGLERHALRLQELLLASAEDPWRGCEEGAWIGLVTWQLAGPQVMKELYATTARLCGQAGRSDVLAHLDYWWDGVGGWRRGLSVPGIPITQAS